MPGNGGPEAVFRSVATEPYGIELWRRTKVRYVGLFQHQLFFGHEQFYRLAFSWSLAWSLTLLGMYCVSGRFLGHVGLQDISFHQHAH